MTVGADAHIRLRAEVGFGPYIAKRTITGPYYEGGHIYENRIGL